MGDSMNVSVNEQYYAELENINKTYGKYRAARDISFRIGKGKLVALLGPSGSGKTTILKLLAGLENADDGHIYIDGRRVDDVKPKDRGIGFVFQNYALFRYKSVYDNVAFGLRIKAKDNGYDRAFIRERTNELIELVGLKGFERRFPRQLSGGQRQRVAFARAIATSPQLLLLDEPFAAIDSKVRRELRGWLRELINEVGITSIFVTHDQEEAIEMADEIILMNNGRIEQIGRPDKIYNNPATAFAAEFMGDNTIIENWQAFKGFEEVQNVDMKEAIRAVIRPEYVSVYAEGEFIDYQATVEETVVTDVVFKGSSLELKINIHGETIKAYRQAGKRTLHKGDTVKILIQRMILTDDNDKATMVENSVYKALDSVSGSVVI